MPIALGAATFVDDVRGEEVAKAASAVRLRHLQQGPFNNVVPAAGAGVRLPRGVLAPGKAK